jgi:protein tyrosine/serine phosphatase
MSYQGTKRYLAGAVLAAVLLSIPSVAPCAEVDSPGPQVSNYAKVSSALSRGARPSRKDIQVLAHEGVKTIIDLRHERSKKEAEFAKSLGMRYIHLPMGYSTPKISTIIAFLDIVLNPNYQPVFVHCRHGSDRTGTVVAIYRMFVQGWSLEQAYEEMREHHFKPWLVGLRNFVVAFGRDKELSELRDSLPLLSIRHSLRAATDRSSGDRMLAAQHQAPGS